MSRRAGIHGGVSFSSGTPRHPAGCRKCSTPKNSAAIAINTRPTVMSLLLLWPCPRIALKAAMSRPPANDITGLTIVIGILPLGLARTRGICTIATKRNSMIPNRRPDQRTWIFAAMLKDADSNAKPTKYAQNKRHGMYEGTLSMMNLAAERCSAPKTAKGMAKHKLLRATILSRPAPRADKGRGTRCIVPLQGKVTDLLRLRLGHVPTRHDNRKRRPASERRPYHPAGCTIVATGLF